MPRSWELTHNLRALVKWVRDQIPQLKMHQCKRFKFWRCWLVSARPPGRWNLCTRRKSANISKSLSHFKTLQVVFSSGVPEILSDCFDFLFAIWIPAFDIKRGFVIQFEDFLFKKVKLKTMLDGAFMSVLNFEWWNHDKRASLVKKRIKPKKRPFSAANKTTTKIWRQFWDPSGVFELHFI